MFEPTVRETLARLATHLPGASRVFTRLGLDFCCGGARRLDQACAERGLTAEVVLAEVIAAPDDAVVDWETAPLDDLVAFIVARYHRALEREMPRLLAMAEKVLHVHGDKDPLRLRDLVVVCRRMFDDLTQHMAKEETILFPWITTRDGRTATWPIWVMLREHDACARDLARIRELTDDFTPPPGACVTWRALWLGLAELDADLRAHMHLENNILFPRALGSDRPRLAEAAP